MAIAIPQPSCGILRNEMPVMSKSQQFRRKQAAYEGIAEKATWEPNHLQPGEWHIWFMLIAILLALVLTGTPPCLPYHRPLFLQLLITTLPELGFNPAVFLLAPCLCLWHSSSSCSPCLPVLWAMFYPTSASRRLASALVLRSCSSLGFLPVDCLVP